MKQRFAVFDIDGTIARTALFHQIVDEMVARGVLPTAMRAQLDQKFEDYRRRAHPEAFKEYSLTSVTILLDNLRNVQVDAYKDAVDAVLTRSGSYNYVYTTQLITQLHEKGYFLIALSGSEMYAVQQFAAQFPFDVAVGETYHSADGYFTGKVEQVVHRKDDYVRRIVQEHNLHYEQSIAVGDSMGDAAMLKIVEQPIAFNPEKKLLDAARSNGWKIVIERKNAIYELEQQHGTYILA
jgi:HAD superfamily hydrolase (TIGR01490 family)